MQTNVQIEKDPLIVYWDEPVNKRNEALNYLDVTREYVDRDAIRNDVPVPPNWIIAKGVAVGACHDGLARPIRPTQYGPQQFLGFSDGIKERDVLVVVSRCSVLLNVRGLKADTKAGAAVFAIEPDEFTLRNEGSQIGILVKVEDLKAGLGVVAFRPWNDPDHELERPEKPKPKPGTVQTAFVR